MRILFHGPFEKMMGREVRLPPPATLSALIGELARRNPAFSRYADLTTDEALMAHVMFVRGGAPLTLSSPLGEDDEIDVFLPVVGG